MTHDSRAAAALARNHLERLLAAPQAGSIRALLPTGFGHAAERYVALLLDANRFVNLTRIVEPEAVARAHLLDALAGLPFLRSAASPAVIDLGSGGGVPALPLALASPDTEWTLVESVGKKAAVLRKLIAALELKRVVVLDERAELLGRTAAHRERYAVATARACAALPVLVEYALPLLRLDGTLLAWKGELGPHDQEVERGGSAARRLGGGAPRLHETGLAALGGHRFVTVNKVRPTPPQFPRRPGEPSRRPLA